jgi:hypothetical protein
MSRQDKLLEKVRNSPKAVRFEDLDRLLTFFGFERRQPGGGSSHYVYFRRPYPPFTVARHKPHIHCKTVKEALAILDEILEQE